MILETTFETQGGVVQLVDFLALEDPTHALEPRAAQPNEVVVRMVTGISGEVPMTMRFEPRFAYGDVTPWIRRAGPVLEALGGPDALSLTSTVELLPGEGYVDASFSVMAGETVWFLASYHLSHLTVVPPRVDMGPEFLAQTERFWREWVARCSYSGGRREDVIRSLLTLKALTYSPTGGVVAAPTTSIPENPGGNRNWDYRYCWLRDATFTLDMFLEQGFKQEAKEWRDWLTRAVAGHSRDLQVMYGVMGERRLTELEIPWLRGYADSRPVRIGNAAHSQFQLDVHGEVMDSFLSARRSGIEIGREEWELERRIVDFVCENWRKPDEGIWETRSGRRHFVHSKVMAWVAVDRGIKAIEFFGMRGPLTKWRLVRSAIKWDVLTRGIDKHRRCFKRAYDQDELDASLLMLPQVGFIKATDPLMVATIDAIQADLTKDGLVLRYHTDRIDDGLPPGEGTFLMCSFWLVNCLVLIGRQAEATLLMDRLLSIRNDLGLLAEQFSPSARRLVGNFPQAFSHVALVDSIMALETTGASPTVRRGDQERSLSGAGGPP